MAVLFNRKDAQVKKYAEELTQEEFLERYKGQTTDTVLKSVWKDYNKQAKVTKEIATQTDQAVEFPEPQETMPAEAQEDTPPAPAPKKAAKKKEVAAPAPKPTPEKKPKADLDAAGNEVKTRATRMRELITEGKDKATVKGILVAEGYEVGASYHSEWNRISK